MWDYGHVLSFFKTHLPTLPVGCLEPGVLLRSVVPELTASEELSIFHLFPVSREPQNVVAYDGFWLST